MKYTWFTIVAVAALLTTTTGCATSTITNTQTIDEAYQATWTAQEEKTTQATETFSLTIGQDELTFISDDVASDVATYVVMDYEVIDVVDQVYHLNLSNPTGRIVDVNGEATEALDPKAVADALWQTYQDMYIDVSAGTSIIIYPAGYESSSITLLQK